MVSVNSFRLRAPLASKVHERRNGTETLNVLFLSKRLYMPKVKAVRPHKWGV